MTAVAIGVAFGVSMLFVHTMGIILGVWWGRVQQRAEMEALRSLSADQKKAVEFWKSRAEEMSGAGR